MEQNNELFYVGRKFRSYQEWDDVFEKYKQQNKLVYTKADGHLLKVSPDVSQSMVDTFLYKNVKFTCKFGPSRPTTAKQHQTR